QRIKSATASTPQHVLVSAMEEMVDLSIWGDDKINVPVLAILAKNPFYPTNIEELNRGIAPNIEQIMWEGVSHWVMMSKPKEFNAAVRAFLDKNKLLMKEMKKSDIVPMPQYYDRYIDLVPDLELAQAFDASIRQLDELDRGLLTRFDGKTWQPLFD